MRSSVSCFLTFGLVWMVPLLLSGAGAEDQRAYIERWKEEAMRQMVEHRIPASITLARAARAGRAERLTASPTTTSASSATRVGRRTDVPRRQEGRIPGLRRPARQLDHSLFLKRDRYASLFELKIDDYKGWAKGLKRCGYATSPTYAKALIELIERHELHRYDDEGVQWIKRGGMPDREALSDATGSDAAGASEGSVGGVDRTVRLSGSRASGISPNDVA